MDELCPPQVHTAATVMVDWPLALVLIVALICLTIVYGISRGE